MVERTFKSTLIILSLLLLVDSGVVAMAGYWPFGLAMCNVWQLSDVVMCTSSIMHMCTISLDRYTAIRDPLGSRAARGRSPVTFWAKIGAVWLTSVVIGSPLIIVGALRPRDLLSEDGQCAIVNAYYLVYGSLVAFFGPLTIMFVTFVLTVRLLRREETQLGADGNGGMMRCTAERKAYPTAAIMTRSTGGSSADGGGRRRRRPTRSGSSRMSRLSRSEAPTTTSMLPSPSKFAHELAPSNTTSGADVGDIPHPVDRRASRDLPPDEDAVNKAETAANDRQALTSSTGARGDKIGSTVTGNCVTGTSASAHALHAATSATVDDVTNVDLGSSSDSHTAVESGDCTYKPEVVSTRDVTRAMSSGYEAIADETPANSYYTDEQQKSTVLVKSVSEFSTLRQPEVVFQRRFVSATSLDSSGKMAGRLRRMVASLHPGHVDAERCCLLKHPDHTRRYVVDNDVVKLLPVESADETGCTCDRHQEAPRVSGPTTEAVVMRRSRSDSAVGMQPPTCCHGDVIQSRDESEPTNNVDESGTAATADVIADTQRPLAADTAAGGHSRGDVIVVNVVERSGTGNDGEVEGQMSKSPSGADRFKGLVRKHGAAFHVAGMLKATRDERHQKVFNSVKTESKAVKVLGTMFVIFVTCWAPFFTVNLIMGVCSSCYVDPLLFKVYHPPVLRHSLPANTSQLSVAISGR